MVKRYDIDPDGEQIETLDGFFVTYTDHAVVAARLDTAISWLRRIEREYPGSLNHDAIDKHLRAPDSAEVKP